MLSDFDESDLTDCTDSEEETEDKKEFTPVRAKKAAAEYKVRTQTPVFTCTIHNTTLS